MHALFFLLFFLGNVSAQEPEKVEKSEASSLKKWGEWRISPAQLSSFQIDRDGLLNERTLWADSRLLVGIGGMLSERDLWEVELELFNGHSWGETTTVGTLGAGVVLQTARHDYSDFLSIVPRKARIAGQRSWGSFSVGADSFGWGNGLLAHDGKTESAFGDPRRGNVVGRLSAAFPTKLLDGGAVFVASDVVLRDENAEILLGDLATQAVVGFRLKQSGLDAGVLGLVRWQRDRLAVGQVSGEGLVSVATPIDAYAKLDLLPENKPLQVELRGEIVSVRGTTERVANGETQGEPGQISSFGAMSGLEFSLPDWGLKADVEWAYASGDNDPYDGVSRTFFMHSDHQLGLVLFEHVLPMITARSADRAGDPGLIGMPAVATRFTVAQGGLVNATVLHPVLSWAFHDQAEVRFGYLNAHSASAFYDLYETAKNGGYNTSPGGVLSTETHLGQEWDLGIRMNGLDTALGQVALLGEGGVFLPGSAMAGVVDAPVYSLRFRASLGW